jgi:hypothetical protein
MPPTLATTNATVAVGLELSFDKVTGHFLRDTQRRHSRSKVVPGTIVAASAATKCTTH